MEITAKSAKKKIDNKLQVRDDISIIDCEGLLKNASDRLLG